MPVCLRPASGGTGAPSASGGPPPELRVLVAVDGPVAELTPEFACHHWELLLNVWARGLADADLELALAAARGLVAELSEEARTRERARR